MPYTCDTFQFVKLPKLPQLRTKQEFGESNHVIFAYCIHVRILNNVKMEMPTGLEPLINETEGQCATLTLPLVFC